MLGSKVFFGPASCAAIPLYKSIICSVPIDGPPSSSIQKSGLPVSISNLATDLSSGTGMPSTISNP